MSFEDLSKQFGFSRAIYYRKRRILRDLDEGKVQPRSKPRRPQLRKWCEAEVALVCKIRRENPTYGKFKIFHILRRDYNFQMSESTVGRILKMLMNKGKISRLISSFRTKRKFNSHTRPLRFKKYEEMVLGEQVQIDYVTVTKNGLSFKHL